METIMVSSLLRWITKNYYIILLSIWFGWVSGNIVLNKMIDTKQKKTINALINVITNQKKLIRELYKMNGLDFEGTSTKGEEKETCYNVKPLYYQLTIRKPG